MPDQRSVMKEYRDLDEKRLGEGLTPEEEARYSRLLDLVGPEVGLPARTGGFDVNAAAEELRESLLPAGLKNRPPRAPPAPAEAAPEISAADALASVYAARPFEPLEDAQAAGADAVFDPAELAAEAAPSDPYAADASQYDGSAGYDPNAQAGWDQSQAWDPNAVPQAGAEPYDPNAAYDPNAPYDPDAPYDPNAAYDPNAPYDPNAAYDPNAPYDPNAAYTPGAELDAAAQSGWDPNQPWATDSRGGWETAAPGEPLAADVGPELAAPLGEYDETAVPPVDGMVEGTVEEMLPLDGAAASAASAGELPEGYEAPLGEYDDIEGLAAGGYAGDAPPDPSTLETAAPDKTPSTQGSRLAIGDPLGGAGATWRSEAAIDAEFRAESGGSFGAGWDAAAPLGEDGAAGDLAPEGEPAALESPGLAPELDFSQPGFSAGDEADFDAAEAGAPVPEVAADGPEIPGMAAEPAAGAAPLDAFEVEVDAAVDADGAALAALAATPAADAPPSVEFGLDDDDDIPTIEAADILEELPPPEMAAAPAPLRMAGSHRVVVHTVEGQVKRGVLEDADLASPTLALASQPGQAAEEVATDNVKAIFFMLAPGEKPPAPEGKKVRVTFHDGRQIAGFCPDYDETAMGFFMIPGDSRTNTGRIWVYRSALGQVAVS